MNDERDDIIIKLREIGLAVKKVKSNKKVFLTIGADGDFLKKYAVNICMFVSSIHYTTYSGEDGDTSEM